jgi:hypothetical protein
MNSLETKKIWLKHAKEHVDQGKTEAEVAQAMGSPSVSHYRSTRTAFKNAVRQAKIYDIAETLRSNVEDKGYVDVGFGAGMRLGVSQVTFHAAVNSLKDEGFVVHMIHAAQEGSSNDKKTTLKVLAPAGTTYKDVVVNRSNISPVTTKKEDSNA